MLEQAATKLERLRHLSSLRVVDHGLLERPEEQCAAALLLMEAPVIAQPLKQVTAIQSDGFFEPVTGVEGARSLKTIRFVESALEFLKVEPVVPPGIEAHEMVAYE